MRWIRNINSLHSSQFATNLTKFENNLPFIQFGALRNFSNDSNSNSNKKYNPNSNDDNLSNNNIGLGRGRGAFGRFMREKSETFIETVQQATTDQLTNNKTPSNNNINNLPIDSLYEQVFSDNIKSREERKSYDDSYGRLTDENGEPLEDEDPQELNDFFNKITINGYEKHRFSKYHSSDYYFRNKYDPFLSDIFMEFEEFDEFDRNGDFEFDFEDEENEDDQLNNHKRAIDDDDDDDDENETVLEDEIKNDVDEKLKKEKESNLIDNKIELQNETEINDKEIEISSNIIKPYKQGGIEVFDSSLGIGHFILLVKDNNKYKKHKKQFSRTMVEVVKDLQPHKLPVMVNNTPVGQMALTSCWDSILQNRHLSPTQKQNSFNLFVKEFDSCCDPKHFDPITIGDRMLEKLGDSDGYDYLNEDLLSNEDDENEWQTSYFNDEKAMQKKEAKIEIVEEEIEEVVEVKETKKKQKSKRK